MGSRAGGGSGAAVGRQADEDKCQTDKLPYSGKFSSDKIFTDFTVGLTSTKNKFYTFYVNTS